MLASLRSRLVLSNLLIILLGLLLVVIVFTQVLVQRTFELKKDELQSQSSAVAVEIQRLYASRGTTEELRSKVNSVSLLLHERIILVGSRGDIRVDSARSTPYVTGSWHPLDQQALKQARSHSDSIRGKNLVLLQSPIRGTHGHRNGGAVVLVSRVSDVYPSPQSLLRPLLVIGGTVLLVWLLIALYFTHSIFRPLVSITSATERMARGDYGARVSTGSRGEMARLAKGFNDMALQVQRSNQVLKAFVANVSHDLRTPLTMIIGFSQALIDGTARREEVTDSAAVIHDEALKMERLVDDLLQLTRLESGLMTLDRHPVEVQAFLGSVVERALHGYGQVSLPAFQIDAQNSLPPIDVDSAQIERALRNLLNNAVQHTPATGTITIQAKRSEDTWVEIGIRDTGTGIPAEEISRVFERFYRTDKGRDRGEEGHAGLGLAIVREIIEAHGGHVWVDSEPGAGSTFCFTVPTAASVGMAAQPVRDADSLRQAAG